MIETATDALGLEIGNELKCRWGIMGTANIAKKNVGSIRATTNGIVVAVASRSIERAQEWAEAHDIPKAYGSYQELIEDAEVDAIYIPLPTTLHKEWSVKAAEQGKHVLCEKPVGINSTEVEEIIEVCKAAKVQYMDGVMFMHHTRLVEMEKIIRDQDSFGDVVHVNTLFTFPANAEFFTENIRSDPSAEPLGCLGDLGWYCVRFALWAFQYEIPEAVTCTYHKTSPRGDKLPTSCSGVLHFSNGRSSCFHSSFHAFFTQKATIQGVKHRIDIDDFVLEQGHESVDFELVRNSVGEEYNTKSRTVSETKTIEGCCQENAMAETFSSLVVNIKKGSDADLSWGRLSLLTQNVLDACVESANNEGKLISMN